MLPDPAAELAQVRPAVFIDARIEPYCERVTGARLMLAGRPRLWLLGLVQKPCWPWDQSMGRRLRPYGWPGRILGWAMGRSNLTGANIRWALRL